jgi:hypothetical protein
MTARTLPITPRVGLSLVHHPTTRLRVPAPAPSVNGLQRLLARWRRSSTFGIHWEERDRLRHGGFPAYVDAYTWLPRPLNAGRRDDW